MQTYIPAFTDNLANAKNINSKNTIYTIGYTAFTIEGFIAALNKYRIKCLIDVRSTPYSSRFKEYDKEQLKAVLAKNGILYRNYSAEFGARQTNPEFINKTFGKVDFTRFIHSNIFNAGVNKIEQGINLGYVFALMCAEKDPINCHRAIMLGRGFKEHGFSVLHIKADSTYESQDQIETRMLDLFFPRRNQITLDATPKSEEALIEQCYLKKNQMIGYSDDYESGDDT